MSVALAELSSPTANTVADSTIRHGVLIVCECPLFRVGLRTFLAQQDDIDFLGEATHLEDVLLLAREQRPDIVLLDGGLTLADPLDLVQLRRQEGVPGILVFAPPTGDEETLFRFLMFGATAYEDRSISGEELLAKMHRLAQGECLMTGDMLPIQAARRNRLARLRQSIMRAASLADGSCPVTQEEDDSKPVSVSPLSEAERAVLEQIAGGATNAQVAQALGISPYTVKNRLDVLFRKLSVCNRTAAAVMAIRKRWITLDGMHSLSL